MLYKQRQGTLSFAVADTAKKFPVPNTALEKQPRESANSSIS